MKLYNEFEDMTSVNRLMKWGYLGSVDADVDSEDIVKMLRDTEVIEESVEIPNCSFAQIEHKGDFYRVYKNYKSDGRVITRVYKMLPTIENDKDFEWERKVVSKGCNVGRVYYFGRPKFFTGLKEYYLYYYLDNGEVKVCHEANPHKPEFWIDSEHASNKYIKANIIHTIGCDFKTLEMAMEKLDPEYQVDNAKGLRYSAIPRRR